MWGNLQGQLFNKARVFPSSGPLRRCNTTDFPIKIRLAVQLEVKQVQFAHIEQKRLGCC